MFFKATSKGWRSWCGLAFFDLFHYSLDRIIGYPNVSFDLFAQLLVSFSERLQVVFDRCLAPFPRCLFSAASFSPIEATKSG